MNFGITAVNGGGVFPRPDQIFMAPDMTDAKVMSWTGGLSKRELFAGAALCGLLPFQGSSPDAALASRSVFLADALIAALAEKKP